LMEFRLNGQNISFYSLTSIFLSTRNYPSIPEGVSVATVIIDGVDVAPAGVVKRSSYLREPGVRPVDTTIHAP
jgi:hypothetical protein